MTAGGKSVINCPACGAWANVLETRDNKGKTQTRRRYECANLHRFTTTEQAVGHVTNAADVSGGRPAVRTGDSGDVDHGRE